MTNQAILNQIKQASNGLLCMSESEYPYEVFLWPGTAPLTPEKVIEKTNHPKDTPVEVVGVDDFFQNATTEEDWQDAEEKETVKKHQALVHTLKTNLRNIQVYRIGTVEIDVYIVGQTADRDCAGVATKVVET
jgi:hypothetical protein